VTASDGISKQRPGKGQLGWGWTREREEKLVFRRECKTLREEERKTEQWEDKSSYIHRSSTKHFPFFVVQRKIPSLIT
jgi:hypothetical protein